MFRQELMILLLQESMSTYEQLVPVSLCDTCTLDVTRNLITEAKNGAQCATKFVNI